MLRLKKSLGQNFLSDRNVINKISSLENLKNQIIIEIGPGSGNLTKSIIQKGPNKIILIEKDARFSNLLKGKLSSHKNLEIYNHDILEFKFDDVVFKDSIIFGNLPYNISTQILAKFISVAKWPPFYKKIIFMFQKEVADRILAKHNTKDYGRISILANFRLEVTDNFKISKNCFFPKPAVDSKIIVFKPKTNINYNIRNIKNLEKITNIFFSNKRKMINKPLSKTFKEYKDVAKKLKLNLSSRPSELSCNDYYRITEFYEKFN
tara:strand:+ start:2773 stop:3564 length:792 start_codon:yes stop_codon:yes gene_type:complete